MQIKVLYMGTLQSIKLGEYHFELLKEIITELNESLINVLFTDYLPYFIGKKRRLVLKSYKNQNLMMTHLIISVKHDLKSVLKKLNTMNANCTSFNPSYESQQKSNS